MNEMSLPPAKQWMRDARCKGMTEIMLGDDPERAKAVCNGTGDYGPVPCPVRAECLEYAVVNHENLGVWGGVGERERRRIRRARRQRAADN